MACLLCLINFFFLAAMLSEYREFPVFGVEAAQMLLVGLSIFVMNLVMAIVMGYKYGSDFVSSHPDNEQEPTVIQ